MSTRSIRFLFAFMIIALFSLPAFAGGKHCANKKASHKDCPMKNHAAVVSSEDVTLTGQLLCRHCNLHETDACEKVFVSEDDTRYPLCPEGDIDAAQSISEHGEATIVVKGKVMELEDGSSILRIETAEKS
ncbi:MAG: hypothetical protein R3338_03015 [Thermoanaerobaculia bacterium]|nr:hypothetical protein [Thermoanaerobaculia bacterium]